MKRCNSQKMSDRVYTAVQARFDFAKTNGWKDPDSLINPLQIRTLSTVPKDWKPEIRTRQHFKRQLPQTAVASKSQQLSDTYLWTTATSAGIHLIYSYFELDTVIQEASLPKIKFVALHHQNAVIQQAVDMRSDRDDDFLGSIVKWAIPEEGSVIYRETVHSSQDKSLSN